MVVQTRLIWLSLLGKRDNISNQQIPNMLSKSKVDQIEVVHEEEEEVSEEADVDMLAFAVVVEVVIEVVIEVPKAVSCVTIALSTDTPAQSAANA